MKSPDMEVKDSGNVHASEERQPDRDQGKSSKGAVREETRRSRVSAIWRDFLETTSAHGCKNICTESSSVTRILWVALVLVQIGLVLFSISTLVVNYLTYPFITDMQVERLSAVPFPAITLCKINYLRKTGNAEIDGYFDSFVYGMLILSEEAEDIGNTTSGETLSSTDFEFIVQNNTFSANEIFDFAFHGHSGNYEPLNISTAFARVEGQEGTCYTMNWDGRRRWNFSLLDSILMQVTLHQNISLSMDIISGIKVYFHEPGDEPGRNTFTVASPGSFVNLRVKPTKYDFLPAPHCSLGGQDCRPGHVDDGYSQARCLRHCVLPRVIRYCQCRSNFDSDVALEEKKHYPFCSLEQLWNCYDFAYDKYLTESLQTLGCGCLPSCQQTMWEVSATASAIPTVAMANYLRGKDGFASYKEDTVIVQLTVQSMLQQHVIHRKKMTLEYIAGTLGGQMGLFLGASLVTLMEFLKTLVHMTWRLVITLLNAQELFHTPL